jgi:hypothetical protein
VLARDDASFDLNLLKGECSMNNIRIVMTNGTVYDVKNDKQSMKELMDYIFGVSARFAVSQWELTEPNMSGMTEVVIVSTHVSSVEV